MTTDHAERGKAWQKPTPTAATPQDGLDKPILVEAGPFSRDAQQIYTDDGANFTTQNLFSLSS